MRRQEKEMDFSVRLGFKRVFIARIWLGVIFMKLALFVTGARVIKPE